MAGLERWVREAHGARLMGAVGEELSLETPLPIRRVTRLWLQLERAETISIGVDPTSGGLRWDACDPTPMAIEGVISTRIVDIKKREAIDLCMERHVTGGRLMRFSHEASPSGLELEFDGFLPLLVLAWGDAIEAWRGDRLEELEAQGYELEPVAW